MCEASLLTPDIPRLHSIAATLEPPSGRTATRQAIGQGHSITSSARGFLDCRVVLH